MQPIAVESETTLDRFRHLLFMLPPLLLYALAVVLFEATADPDKPFSPLLLAAVQGAGAPGVEQALAELKARLVWLAAALLNIVVPLVAMLYCIVTLRRSVGRGQFIVTAAIGALLGAAILGLLAFGAEGSVMYQLVFGFTYSSLAHGGSFGDEYLQKVYVIIALINVLATIAPVFMLMTTCATVASLAIEDDPEHIAVRARHLKEVIAVASVFLVVGMLHMSVWLGWASSLSSDPGLQSALSGVASSVSAYWGVAFTTVLIGAYVPPALYLNKRAQALVREIGQAMTPEEAEQWLSERGLSFKLSNQLTQYLSIIAPFLAAPLSATMSFS